MPMGEHRNKVTAIRLHRMGTTPGWPDFLFCGPERAVFWLELKRRGSGRLSDAQIDCAAHLAACGFPYLCTNDVNEAIAELKRLGIIRSIEVQ